MPLRYMKNVILITLLLLLAVHAQGLVEPGRIVVHATPLGAAACIDAVYCDTTDATFTVSGNTWHSVVVTQNGYLPWSDNVFVISDQNTMVDAEMELNPSATVIRVDVTPGGGTVCLDDSQCRGNVGTSSSSGSTQFTGMSQGYHTITVGSTAGYLDYYTPVYVDLGKITPVTITLNPSISSATYMTSLVTPAAPGTGVVRVYVDRTGSTICIDNVDCRNNVGGSAGPETGSTLFTNVTANSVHSISVAADGYKPYSAQVSVGKDMVNTVDVSLQPLAAETTAPTRTPATLPLATPTLLPTRAGLDAVPVLGALVMCGAFFLFRNRGR
jgi:PEGA domain